MPHSPGELLRVLRVRAASEPFEHAPDSRDGRPSRRAPGTAPHRAVRAPHGGFDVRGEDVARLSPSVRHHINVTGRYSFQLPEMPGGLPNPAP